MDQPGFYVNSTVQFGTIVGAYYPPPQVAPPPLSSDRPSTGQVYPVGVV